MKSVLITGTSKGIGYETALAFGRAGYRVHATMRNPSQSPALAQIAANEKLAITVTAMDVNNDDSVRDGMARIQAQHGPIDILVNNAGIEAAGSIEEEPFADYRATMETNYFGVIRCIKGVVTQMRKRRNGTIINISSVGGSICNPPLAAYGASKWALEALSESLACEMKSFGVHVALVKPGIIDTAMAQRITTIGSSEYPHAARMSNTFKQVLHDAPIPPSVVADKVLEIVTSGTWQFRHLVGPDAEGLIAWRKGMTDEQWIDLHSADDETYQKMMGKAAAAD
jgi:NAD(P)-dependent dehydrogenase (short-subunit alcohol dehydrogenase family)